MSTGENLRVVCVAWICGLLFAPAALAACLSTQYPAESVRGVSSSSGADPTNRLVVLGRSMTGIALGEPRASVQKTLGRGTIKSRGFVVYVDGRLRIDYWFHGRLTTRVQSLETRWSGFHTRAGVRVGTTRRALRALGVACADRECSLAAGRGPDAPGTVFALRQGQVSQIDIFYG